MRIDGGGGLPPLPSKDERMKIENESIARYVASHIIFSIVYIIIHIGCPFHRLKKRDVHVPRNVTCMYPSKGDNQHCMESSAE